MNGELSQDVLGEMGAAGRTLGWVANSALGVVSLCEQGDTLEELRAAASKARELANDSEKAAQDLEYALAQAEQEAQEREYDCDGSDECACVACQRERGELG